MLCDVVMHVCFRAACMVCVCVFVCVCVCMCMYVCVTCVHGMYVCIILYDVVYLCMYVFTYLFSTVCLQLTVRPGAYYNAQHATTYYILYVDVLNRLMQEDKQEFRRVGKAGDKGARSPTPKLTGPPGKAHRGHAGEKNR